MTTAEETRFKLHYEVAAEENDLFVQALSDKAMKLAHQDHHSYDRDQCLDILLQMIKKERTIAINNFEMRFWADIKKTKQIALVGKSFGCFGADHTILLFA